MIELGKGADRHNRLMNQLRKFIASPVISVSRFYHCPFTPHRDPPEEIATCYSINFIEKGNYSLFVGTRKWMMSQTKVFVTYPGLVFRCRHAEQFPEDVSFSVSYNSKLFEATDSNWAGGDRSTCVITLNNRMNYIWLRLQHLTTQSKDVLEAESLAAQLVAVSFDEGNTTKRRLYGRRQFAWYMERVDAAQRLMQTQYSSPHSLESLARFAGISTFHFARVFRELTGTPPHRYLVNVRLEFASKLLLDGASVTEACFASGFTNLSHFIRLFQRTFHLSPSKFAKTCKLSRRANVLGGKYGRDS